MVTKTRKQSKRIKLTKQRMKGGGKMGMPSMSSIPGFKSAKNAVSRGSKSFGTNELVTSPDSAMDYIIKRFTIYINEILHTPNTDDPADLRKHTKKISTYIEKFASFKRKAINLLVMLDPTYITKVDDKFKGIILDDSQLEYRIVSKLGDAIDKSLESQLNVGKLISMGNKEYKGDDEQTKKALANDKNIWEKTINNYETIFKNTGNHNLRNMSVKDFLDQSKLVKKDTKEDAVTAYDENDTE